MLSRDSQVQFLKIGDQYINLNNVAHIEFYMSEEPSGYTELPRITFYFAAVGPEGWEMSLTYRGAEARAIEKHLRSVLAVLTAAQIDLPAKVAEVVANPLGAALPAEPSPLDNF